MKFQYYWDHGIWPDIGDDKMAAPTDIQKLMQRVQRGSALLDKSAKDGESADRIMDEHEKTMDKFNAHFGSIKEYSNQLNTILTNMGGNAGPPLDATFQSTAPANPPVKIDPATGDPVK